jgi:hypothetical protein
MVIMDLIVSPTKYPPGGISILPDSYILHGKLLLMRSLLVLLLCPIIVSAQINPAYIFKSNLSYSKLEASGDGMFGFEKDGKFGYMDKNEKVIVPAIYSYDGSSYTIPVFNKGYVIIKKDGKLGMLDKTGKIVLPFEYDYIGYVQFPGKNAAVSKKNGSKSLYGIVNDQNKILIPLEYDDIFADSNYITVKQNGKWGLFENTGKKLLETEYYSLTPYAKEKVLKAEKDGKYGYIDIAGKWLFDKAKNVYTLYGESQGMVLCMVSSKYGFLDLKGDEAIITKYDYAANFENTGLAKVGKKITGTSYSNYYGYIDKKGTEVIPVKYESMGIFSNGLVVAKDPETNRYGYLDKTGKWAIKATYLEGFGFDEMGGAWVKMTDGKYHYINTTGKDFGTFDTISYKSFNRDGYSVYEHTDYPYAMIDKTGTITTKLNDCDAIYTFSDGIAGYRCKSISKYGFIDVTGKMIGACTYDGFTGFVDGVARIETKVSGKTKYGYITARGETILAAEYDDLRVFRNGWGLMKKDGNYFFVDKNGNTKEPPRKYDNLVEFRSGFAVGTINAASKEDPNTYYYINTELKEAFNISAYQGYQFWENVAVVNRDTVYALMNKKGEVFKRLDGIEQLKFCSDGMLAVKQKGKWGYIDDRGNMVITPKYDSSDVFKNGYARFKMGTKWGLVDKTGKEIVEAKYENVFGGENGVIIFYDNSWGIMDKTGKITVAPRFYSLTPFEKDRALARLGKSFTILKSPLAK